MSNKMPFTISYNGKNTQCTQEGNLYIVQISYKPLYLETVNTEKGKSWIERESGIETPLSKEIGQLIEKQFLNPVE